MACSVFSPIPLPRPRPNRLRVLASLKSMREASHRQSGDVPDGEHSHCFRHSAVRLPLSEFAT
jgi:hypothetical protein